MASALQHAAAFLVLGFVDFAARESFLQDMSRAVVAAIRCDARAS